MKVLFIETNMGASGDMLLGSLTELLPDPDEFISRLNNLGLEGLSVERKIKTTGGIAGSRIKIRFDNEEEGGHYDHPQGEHHQDHGQSECCGRHRHEESHSAHAHKKEESVHSELLTELHYANKQGHSHEKDHKHVGCCGKHHKKVKGYHHKHHDRHENHDHHDKHHRGEAELGLIIDTLAIPDEVKKQAKDIYHILAEAESVAHNKPAEQIHFHELGEKDAVLDIVAVCLALRELGVEKIIATPIHVGYGRVKTAHGKLPVPTPATAEILRGIPIYSKGIVGELCTPTGAALLKYFVEEFIPMPVAKWEKIGYGIGSKKFEEPNMLRAFLGELQ